ncbi:hypothetical protein C8R45DRAFT_946849 [Mycena sanguinolenta]|nr:hypothetical protein C8R45DRAFT_946849 [Mycena sanguinolenta]
MTPRPRAPRSLTQTTIFLSALRPQELQVSQVLQYLCLKTFWKLFKLDLDRDIKELCSSGLLVQVHPSSFSVFEFSGSNCSRSPLVMAGWVLQWSLCCAIVLDLRGYQGM